MRRLFAVLGAAMLVAVSCSSSNTPGAASASAGATEVPQQGGRVIEPTTSDISTIQPVLSNDTASARIIGLIYDSLLIQDPQNGEPKARLASFTQSSDGLTYTFEINAKANWSDGKPVIGDDVVTAIKAVGKSKKTVRKSNYQDVQGFKEYSAGTATTLPGVKVDPTNPKKVVITMTKVSCPAILDLNTIQPLPTQVFGKYVTDASKDEIDTAPENTAPTVFSGPFKFNEWRKGDQVILDKNPTYWQGAPNIDQYVYKVVANSTAITNGLKTGELTFGTIQAKDLADMQTVDTVKITKYPLLGYTFIGWNTASPTAIGLADKRVRQALAYGIDMDQVIKAVVFGEAVKNVSHHVTVQWAYPSGIQLNQYA
jgi:peptide/nickel transport system substrate-binding protein